MAAQNSWKLQKRKILFAEICYWRPLQLCPLLKFKISSAKNKKIAFSKALFLDKSVKKAIFRFEMFRVSVCPF